MFINSYVNGCIPPITILSYQNCCNNPKQLTFTYNNLTNVLSSGEYSFTSDQNFLQKIEHFQCASNLSLDSGVSIILARTQTVNEAGSITQPGSQAASTNSSTYHQLVQSFTATDSSGNPIGFIQGVSGYWTQTDDPQNVFAINTNPIQSLVTVASGIYKDYLDGSIILNQNNITFERNIYVYPPR